MLSPLHHPGSVITTDSIAILGNTFCFLADLTELILTILHLNLAKKRGLRVYIVGLSNLYVKHTNNVPTGHVKTG